MGRRLRKLRVLLLADKDLVPPEDYEGTDYTKEPWKTEYDILATLQNLGHEARVLGVLRDVERIREVFSEWVPHIAFNLLEDVYGVIAYDHNVVAYLELLGLAYTGCHPLGLELSRDKVLTKKLLTYHRVRTPKFLVCRRGRKVRRPARLGFPLIVKSAIEEASLGISRRSVVEDDASLQDRTTFIHEQRGTDAIAEEFIPGREIYVGVLGNKRLDVFPPWELLLDNRPEDVPLIATHKVKFDREYQKKIGLRTRRAEGLPGELEARLTKLSRRIYRILNLSGYARLDFRLTEEGVPYLLEANANPHLGFGEDFAESAECAGIPYGNLIQRILNLGVRWQQSHDIM